MFKKNLIVFTLLFTLPFLAYAQIKNPVSWSVGYEKISDSKYKLQFNATISGDWHIYDLGPYDEGPNPTDVIFENPQGYIFISNLEMPVKPVVEFDKMFQVNVGYFNKEAKFERSIDRIDVEEYSFLQALNHILTEGKYKPETKLKVFTKQFNIKLLKDELIDTNYIKELCNKINIEHEDEDEKTENVLDGISVIVLEKDCDDVYNSIIYKGGKKMKNNIAMVLNEGGKYYPIHRNDKYVFSKKDKNVQDIISETN
jgi:hypothetical protein